MISQIVKKETNRKQSINQSINFFMKLISKARLVTRWTVRSVHDLPAAPSRELGYL